MEENENIRALKELLLAPYRQPNGADKRGALYWQSVLIARRFILVLIFSVVTEPSIRLFSMTFACVLVFFYHLKVKRVFFVCCWSISKFLIRPCAQRWFPRDSSQALLDVCDSTDDYMERDVIN